MRRHVLFVLVPMVSALCACSSKSSSDQSPPIVTSGSYWKSDSYGAPNLQFASDGTGKMSFQAGSQPPSFQPLQFTWTTVASDAVSVTLKTGPAPSALTGLQARFAANDPGAKPGRIVVSWNAVDGADGYNVYKASGSNPPALQAQLVTATTLTDDGYVLSCGIVTPNFDGDYTFTVKAVHNWVEGVAAMANATVSGNPRGGGGAPSEGCTIPPNAPQTSNQPILTLDPTRLSRISVDDPSNPSSLTLTAVTAGGTQDWKLELASGAL